MAKTKSPKPKYGRIYWPNCAVCQYMKNNAAFRYRVMQSTYFNINGTESLSEVLHAFGDPIKPVTVYSHMRRHQAKDLIKMERQQLATPVVDIVEARRSSDAEHEIALDEFITEGRKKLIMREIPVTATTLLQAIRIKADIEKSTKDRRVDVLKMMKGAAPDGTREDSEGSV